MLAASQLQLARLTAAQQGRFDFELAARYGCCEHATPYLDSNLNIVYAITILVLLLTFYLLAERCYFSAHTPPPYPLDNICATGSLHT